VAIVEFENSPIRSRRNIAGRTPLAQLGVPNPGPSSRGSTFYKSMLACPREHGLAQEARVVSDVTAEALTVGLLFHQALEAYYGVVYTHQQAWLENDTRRTEEFFWGAHRPAMKEAFAVLIPLEDQKEYTVEYDTCMRLLDAYFGMYNRQDRWEILAVEENLEYHGAFVYTARLDLVIYDHKDRAVYIVEHKTAAQLSEDLLDNYEMDWQILGQVFLFNQCVDLNAYPFFGGVLINLVSKHKEPRLVRVPVNPSPDHLKDFARNFVKWVKLRDAYAQLGWPKSLGHCAGYARGYSKCTYYSLCHGNPNHTVQDWKDEEPPLGYVRRQVPGG
jgi:hypothetical protein